jgi:hypothetical protein
MRKQTNISITGWYGRSFSAFYKSLPRRLLFDSFPRYIPIAQFFKTSTIYFSSRHITFKTYFINEVCLFQSKVYSQVVYILFFIENIWLIIIKSENQNITHKSQIARCLEQKKRLFYIILYAIKFSITFVNKSDTFLDF